MRITEEKQKEIHIITLEGRLDSSTAPALEERIDAAILRGEKQMILDFVRLDYISSAGLRVIVKTVKELAPRDGKLVLCSMVDYIKEVFEVAGFTSFLPIADNRDQAERLFDPPATER
jgi:anti-sigma B factor antagonist